MPDFIPWREQNGSGTGTLYGRGSGPGPGGGCRRGCVIVQDGRIVGRGRNRREETQTTVSHAEMEAIAQANRALGTWRLDTCELYVTLEPCPMCAGAILNARIPRVWYGARDRAFGACGGVTNLFMEEFPNRPWWAAFWEKRAGRY